MITTGMTTTAVMTSTIATKTHTRRVAALALPARGRVGVGWKSSPPSLTGLIVASETPRIATSDVFTMRGQFNGPELLCVWLTCTKLPVSTSAYHSLSIGVPSSNAQRRP